MNQIPNKIDEIKRQLDTKALAKEGARYLKSITPIDKGGARTNTYAAGDEIVADYPYAGRLDDNYSKQTKGQGLIQPTIEYLEQLVTKIGQ
jgi:hypothetical protein